MKTIFKRFFGQSKTKSGTPPGEGQQGVQTNAGQSAEAATYSSDQPIRSRQEDRFNRSGFATRIADTIAGRNDPSSIVVGLYAPWGDGKTSTLHLMEEALAEHPHIVVVRFNPWHFQSEEQLLKGFFATVASGLPHRADFRRDSYDAIAKLVDPGILVANLRQRYGLELDAPEFHHSDDVPLARRIAHQFTYIHQKVREEQTQAGIGAEPSAR